MQDQPDPQREPVQTISYAMPQRPRVEPLAIASLIFGLLLFFPIIAPVLAIVLGWMARRRLAANPHMRGRGMALAGIILGTASIVVTFASIPSVLEAARVRNRVRCMSNLRQICLATLIYSNDNRHMLPANPAPLNKYLKNPGVWICPERGLSVAGGGGGGVASSYIYLGSQLGPSVYKVRSSQTILAYEPMSNHGGRGFCVVYLDGHAEWVPKERATAVMQQIQQSIVNRTTGAVGN